jgi:lipoate-protein ligase A
MRLTHIGRVLEYESDDLHFNLALEHAILILHSQSNYFMTLRFWRNPKSVIIGRSQLVNEEVNLSYCRQNSIQVARRITGGGAVYQDEGSLNVSIFVARNAMRNGNNIHSICELFTEILAESLRKEGFKVEHEGNNNILYRGRKVSGAASYFTKKWLLHHATILVSANLERLERSLIHHTGGPHYRSRSKYLSTINLAGLAVDDWKATLIELFEQEFGVRIKPDTISNEEHDLAVKLRESMYSRSSWIKEGKRTYWPFD